eukprot:3767846-Pleurochrysis_carterae.AAC.1
MGVRMSVCMGAHTGPPGPRAPARASRLRPSCQVRRPTSRPPARRKTARASEEAGFDDCGRSLV